MATIIDDFEDNDLSEYNQYPDGGTIQVQTGTVYNGTYAADLYSSNHLDDPTMYSPPGNGLNSYPSPGNVITTRVQFGGTVDHDPRFYFGGTDIDNCYWVRLWGRADVTTTFDLFRIEGGSTTTLDSVDRGYTSGIWYKLEITWETNGDITVKLFDDSSNLLDTLSANDTTYQSEGGVGYSGGNTADVEKHGYHDYTVQTALNTPPNAPTTPSPTDGATGVILN